MSTTEKAYTLADAQADVELVVALTQSAVDALEEAAAVARSMERFGMDDGAGVSFTFSYAITTTMAGIAADIEEEDTPPKQIAREAREAARLVGLIATDAKTRSDD